MKALLKTGIFFGFASITSSVSLVSPLNAQVVSDPVFLEVAGVRLGMSLDEAIMAIKGFNNHFVIEKHYLIGPKNGFNDVGLTKDKLSESSGNSELNRDYAYFNDLEAIDEGSRKPEFNCSLGRSLANGCPPTYFDDSVDIKVWFSPVKGQEKVIAIYEEKVFHKEPYSSVAGIKKAMLSTYKEPITSEKQYDRQYSAQWSLDQRKRVMTESMAKSRGADYVWGLPRLVRSSDSIFLSIMVESTAQNDNLASRYVITLFDGAAFMRSLEESNLNYKASKTKQDNSALSSNSTKEKF